MPEKHFRRLSLSIELSDEARCYLKQLAAKDRRSLTVYLSVALESWYDRALAAGDSSAIECSGGVVAEIPTLNQLQTRDMPASDDFVPMKKRW
jgi:predicted transcriptional regulator